MSTARYYDLIKGPFRAVKLVAISGANVAVIAVILSVIWVDFRSIGMFLAAGYLVFSSLVMLILLTRLFGKLHDTHAAVSLYAHLPLTARGIGDLFVDGAAANASFLLFLYKCLAFCKPRRILEFGSGQSSKLLAHYFHENPAVYVCTLEHNNAWFETLRPLLTKDERCHDYRHSLLTDRNFVCQGSQERVRTMWYTVPPELKEQPFDLILVDGPDTGPETKHGREGFLEHVPQAMAESFVVIFDDAERGKEIRLVKSFQRILQSRGIHFVRFDIEAVKTQTVFCSPNFAFLRSV